VTGACGGNGTSGCAGTKAREERAQERAEREQECAELEQKRQEDLKLLEQHRWQDLEHLEQVSRQERAQLTLPVEGLCELNTTQGQTLEVLREQNQKMAGEIRKAHAP
jgi:hypothetical protein